MQISRSWPLVIAVLLACGEFTDSFQILPPVCHLRVARTPLAAISRSRLPLLGQKRPSLSLTSLRMDAGLEDEIKWVPLALGPDQEPNAGASVLPLFPLGGTVYLPHSEHVLNIFEPRYRALYNDILFSGSRRFAVCAVNQEDGSFAQYASVFYLKDLKEVSEQTGDSVKYVCDHEVIDRVRIDKILNPRAWVNRATYLKAEVTYVTEPEDVSSDATVAFENELFEDFKALVDIQHELGENVKFTKTSPNNFNTSFGTGLWGTTRMWQNYQDQRLVARQVEMQQQFQERLMKYLIQDQKNSKLPEIVNISDLPPNLQAEVKSLQMRMADDLAPIQNKNTKDLMLMLQSESHMQRLQYLKHLIAEEKKLLNTKKSLKSLLSG